MKPLVYIASPYTKGDQALNVRFQMQVFDTLLSDNFVIPLAPLWSHFQHMVYPRPYEDWLSHDMELIARCDCCLRLDSSVIAPNIDYWCTESPGADREVKEFKSLGKPVYFSYRELYASLDHHHDS